jgi:hypothetical protein
MAATHGVDPAAMVPDQPFQAAAHLRFPGRFADNAIMDRRSLRLLVFSTFALGMVIFVGVRWVELTSIRVGADWQSAAWLTLPIALTYAGAVATGLILLRDGVTRWWWIPATLFVVLGAPVGDWVGWSIVASQIGHVAGAVLDLATILGPLALLAVRTEGRKGIATRDRLIPTVFIAAVAMVLAMRIGESGPDVTLSVGLALLALGHLSQSASWRRAAAFVVIALALGTQVPASFVIAMSQGLAGSTAWVDASMDVVVAVLAFGMVPMTHAWERLLQRRAPRVVAEAPTS